MPEASRAHETNELEPESAIPEVSLSADDLKAAFRGYPAGVAVITADDGDGPVAMTATSLFSVSAEPPLLVFSASRLSSSAPTLLNAETLVVHLLDEDSLHIGRLGATSGVDRFADTGLWRRLPTGEPVFTDVKIWIRGKVINRFDTSGSTLLVVHAVESSIETEGVAERAAEAAPLVYHNRNWHRLGDASMVAG